MHDQLDVLADAAGQQALQVGGDEAEIEGFGLGLLATPEDQQLPGEGGGPLGGRADLLDVGPRRVVAGGRLGHESGAVEDDREQVIEVVCDSTGQLAQALEPLSLVQPVLQPLPCGLGLQPMLDGLVFQRLLVGGFQLACPLSHRRFQRGVQLLQASHQLAVFAAEPGAVQAGFHAAHELIGRHRLGQVVVGHADSGDRVVGGGVPGEQDHPQVRVGGFQAGRQRDPRGVGEPLIDHGQVRAAITAAGLGGPPRSETLSGDPGQGKDIDDGLPHPRVVVHDVDHRRPDRRDCIRCGGGHLLAWDASQTRLSNRRVSNGLCTMAKALASTATRSRSSRA